MTPPDGNDWMEYRQFVVSKLADLDHKQDELGDQMTLVRIDLAMLKVRSGIWGGLAGTIPATVAVIAVFLGVH